MKNFTELQKIILVVLGIVALLVLLVLGGTVWFLSFLIPSTSPLAEPSPTADLPILEFISVAGTSNENLFRVEGQIKNISPDKTCAFIEIIVQYYDDNGNFITSDKGDIDFSSLGPGQISPFKILTRRQTYPNYDKYDVSARTPLGCFD